MTASSATPITIALMAEELGRAEHTVRQWIREGALPKHLMPRREGGRQKLVWDRSQLDGMREFAKQREQRRGWQHPAPAA